MDKENASLSEKEKLEWVETFQHINQLQAQEKKGIRERMINKIKSNPFVPIGMLATTAALSVGVYSMKTGNKKRSQLMMRTRILAQGFTVAALLLGIVVASKTKPTEN
ncbi:HIG1 domain family member 2A, mitochondrial [Trichonephila inaurata madagascariensis]|uniref:HIG1 domain family member 2A, mitochondrial n=1 Tax=Trichonephila inaurata madagascariensis TaxID=2747483 RepID=A0A8X7BN50_9ARAC|nr:HIG1 domain family member 2A, mitochondrial [Trichonephila inaurata madagascariensis]